MRLESALYSSRSGIDAHGQAIGVVGDNIANANTTGFKASRAEFQDMFTEGFDGRASIAGPAVGNGTSITEVRPIHISGGIEPTGRGLDAAIDGNGFFIAGNPENPVFTRDGAFELNEAGFLTTNTGQQVLGYPSGSQTLGPINMLTLTGIVGEATTQAAVTGNLPSESDFTTPPQNPTSFAQIADSASFQMTMDIYDSLGQSHAVQLSFFHTAANTWTAQAHIDGGDVQGGTAGVPTQLGADLSIPFGTNGVIDPANRAAATLTIAPAFTNGAAAGNVTVDLSNFTQYAGPGTTAAINLDGQPTGRISSYDIERNGDIQAVLSNGIRIPVGTLVLADFVNVDGLNRVGDNDFAQTGDSGAPILLRPGEQSVGLISGGSLELSTTDLGKEFTNLVLYQRGYEANSKVLNSASDLIRQTIQLLG